MFRAFRHRMISFVILSPAFLIGCTSQISNTKVDSNGSTGAVSANFSLDTPVETIAANQRGKAVLDRDVPGLMASQSYLLFEDMSLSQIATMSGGKLTETKLNRVQSDLAQLDVRSR